MDGDLAQAHLAQGPGVLVGRPDGVAGGLLVARLVHHQHGLVIGEFAGDPRGEAVTGQVVVDAGAGEEVLQAVRTGVAQGLGERPAVAGVQLHQHRLAHLPCQQAGFTPGEAVRHRGHGRPYDLCPLTLGYRGLRGHLVLDRRHKRS